MAFSKHVKKYAAEGHWQSSTFKSTLHLRVEAVNLFDQTRGGIVVGQR